MAHAVLGKCSKCGKRDKVYTVNKYCDECLADKAEAEYFTKTLPKKEQEFWKKMESIMSEEDDTSDDED